MEWKTDSCTPEKGKDRWPFRQNCKNNLFANYIFFAPYLDCEHLDLDTCNIFDVDPPRKLFIPGHVTSFHVAFTSLINLSYLALTVFQGGQLKKCKNFPIFQNEVGSFIISHSGLNGWGGCNISSYCGKCIIFTYLHCDVNTYLDNRELEEFQCGLYSPAKWMWRKYIESFLTKYSALLHLHILLLLPVGQVVVSNLIPHDLWEEPYAIKHTRRSLSMPRKPIMSQASGTSPKAPCCASVNLKWMFDVKV